MFLSCLVSPTTETSFNIRLLNDVSAVGDEERQNKNIVAKGVFSWIINHGDISKCSRAEMRKSYKTISITCTDLCMEISLLGLPKSFMKRWKILKF
uniref:Uncharacterized protein n=1 Tax=Lactuca sativa TaxID=4236 RepID=A0A9R1XP40_LACSA|nr:hypothetical protein LSAT_V11C200061350 [Lactuca sativa]